MPILSDDSERIKRTLADDECRERNHGREDGVAARKEHLGRIVLP